MKGVTLFSDLFVLFILIVVVILMCGLIWVFTMIYSVEATLGFANPREVTLRIFFNPLKYESVLLSFLELKHQEISMKEILTLVAIQNNTNIWVDGKNIDAKAVSEDFLGKMLEKPYLLKTVDPQITIASYSYSSSWQKISTKLFLLNGEAVDLEFYVG